MVNMEDCTAIYERMAKSMFAIKFNRDDKAVKIDIEFIYLFLIIWKRL